MITYEDVNKGIEKIVEYLDSTKNIWGEIRTLKLHNAFFEAEDILKKYPLVQEKMNHDEAFYAFCEDAYRDFEEWMEEEGIEDMRKYIGRTSSFYLTNIHDRTPVYVLYNVLDLVCGGTAYCTFSMKDGKVCMDELTDAEYHDEAQDEMEYFSKGECLEDIKKYLEPAKKEADYIDSFKKNQVEYFKEWLGDRENILELEKEEEYRRQYEIETITMACYI